MEYKNFDEMPMFISIPETARLLGIVPASLYRVIENDPSFPVVALGRRKVIPTAQLKEWIAKKCTRN
jgi:predicted DNA-binding transcriptional regulator AlpA